MEIISCIYKITSPNKRVYVGQTIDFKRRCKTYNSVNAVTPQRKLHNSMLKYGVKNHKIEIIEYCEPGFLDIREDYWIIRLNAASKFNLNISHGNFKTGLKISLHAKDAISKANSKEVSQYDLYGNYLKTFVSRTVASKETGANLSNIGRCCNGFIGNVGGFIWSNEKQDKIKVSDIVERNRPKPFLMFSKKGEKIAEFSSYNDLTEKGFNLLNVERCLSGKRKSANGFIYIYKEKYNGQKIEYTLPEKKLPKTSRKINKYDKVGNLLGTYDSLTDAAKKNGAWPSDIKKCCVGKAKTVKKHIYKFA